LEWLVVPNGLKGSSLRKSRAAGIAPAAEPRMLELVIADRAV
jgi:hypothetical protein